MKVAICTECGEKFEFSEYERDESGARRKPEYCDECKWVW